MKLFLSAEYEAVQAERAGRAPDPAAAEQGLLAVAPALVVPCVRVTVVLDRPGCRQALRSIRRART